MCRIVWFQISSNLDPNYLQRLSAGNNKITTDGEKILKEHIKMLWESGKKTGLIIKVRG